MDKRITLIAVVALGVGVFGTAGAAKAAPVTISYEGIITRVYDPEGKLDGSVVVGGTFSGQYTFESTQPDSVPGDPKYGQYSYDEKAPAGMTMSVTVGDYGFETSSTDPRPYISVMDNRPLAEGQEDSYFVNGSRISQVAGPAIDPYGLSQMGFELITRENLSTFTSDALPLSMPNVGNFEYHNSFAIELVASGWRVGVGGQLSVPVPDAVGKSLHAAQSAITSAGFVVGTTSGRHSDTVPAGYVLSQDPTAGTLAAPGSAVDLVLSIGSGGPTGWQACCFDDGSCQDLTRDECLARGGTPRGAGTTCATTDCEQPAVPGLVAHYKLDETSGTTALDSSGNNNHGTLYGNPTWQPTDGMVDGALLLDGLGGYVDCGNDSSFDIAEEITLAAWVKTNDSGNSDWNPYVTKGDAAYGLKHHRSNKIEFAIYTGTYHVALFPVDSSFNGLWHHLAGTYDGSEVRLYIDGKLEAASPAAGSIATNAFNLNIGRTFEMPDWLYNGSIDDVRIYDYPLNETEIKALATVEELLVPDLVGMSPTEAIGAITSAGLVIGQIDFKHSDTIGAGYVSGQNPAAGTSVAQGSSVHLTLSLGPAARELQACCLADGSCLDLTREECLAQGGIPWGEGTSCVTTDCGQPPPGNLVAHWKLDETIGVLASDSTRNGHDGALYGDPVWVPGKVDGALAFDGIDDYVDCGNDSRFDITEEITLAAWVKTNDSGNDDCNPYVTKGDAAYGLKHHRTNKIEFAIYTGTFHVALFPVDSSFNGLWHHLAGTYDGSTVRLYIDGKLEVASPGTGSIATNTFNLNIGRTFEIPDWLYSGLIDDVRVYDYALSGDEVMQLVCTDPPPGDANGDCKVDFVDLAIFMSNWLRCDLPVQELCGQ